MTKCPELHRGGTRPIGGDGRPRPGKCGNGTANAKEVLWPVGERPFVRARRPRSPLAPDQATEARSGVARPFPCPAKIRTSRLELELEGRRKKRKVVHVNILKKWFLPLTLAGYVDHQAPDEILKSLQKLLPLPRKIPGARRALATRSATNSQQTRSRNYRLFPGSSTTNSATNPGRTSLAEHVISTGPASPVRQHPYRLPYSRRATVRDELQKMLDMDIIQPSTSPWASPIVLDTKKYGSIRFCVDYRTLNRMVDFDAYPIPRVDAILDKVSSAKYISMIDLTRGYWQIPLEEDSRQKSAFVTEFGLYEFKTMPFGLHGAPATFQRLMNRVLRGPEEFLDAFLNDNAVFSDTWEEHIQHLRAFIRLKEILCSDPVLLAPNLDEVFILQTDASKEGLGAVLSQADHKGQERPVAYINRKLLPREKTYSTIEKEALAIKWAMEKLKVYLLGREFVVQTDHVPLQFMELHANNARGARWGLALQPFRFLSPPWPGMLQSKCGFLEPPLNLNFLLLLSNSLAHNFLVLSVLFYFYPFYLALFWITPEVACPLHAATGKMGECEESARVRGQLWPTCSPHVRHHPFSWALVCYFFAFEFWRVIDLVAPHDADLTRRTRVFCMLEGQGSLESFTSCFCSPSCCSCFCWCYCTCFPVRVLHVSV